MIPQFDILGYLTPYNIVDFTYEDFKYYFVESYPVTSTRYTIFEKYNRYINDFKQFVTPEFTHWVGGSFVTNTINPNDIDFITIINYRTVIAKNSIIKSQFESENGYKNYGVDAYFIRKYPYGHDKFWIFEKDCVIWREDLGTDRNNLPKGMVQIQFK